MRFIKQNYFSMTDAFFQTNFIKLGWPVIPRASFSLFDQSDVSNLTCCQSLLLCWSVNLDQGVKQSVKLCLSFAGGQISFSGRIQILEDGSLLIASVRSTDQV